MAVKEPAPCRDTTLYKIVGRAEPHPVASFPVDDNEALEKVAAKIVAERAKAAAAGCEISFVTVQGHGRADDPSLAAANAAMEKMASQIDSLKTRLNEVEGGQNA